MEIKLTDVKKTYRMGENEVHALRGVNLRIRPGEFVAIMGPSGSGKSTLMHVLGLLDVPDAGTYHLNGREVGGLGEDALAILRRKSLGFIFQQFNLLPRLSALENIAMPLSYTRLRRDVAGAEALLAQVGLEARREHRPNQLSGGQQQRVAIARSLVNAPSVVFADEPTGNLDSASEKEIMTILRELNARGITVILVTHEEEIARQAKRLIRMRDGQIQSDEVLKPSSEGKLPALSPVPSDEMEGKPTLAEVLHHFKQGFATLMANKVRTFLSVLGILIGVAAVVAMLALGKGAQEAIRSQLASLGSNLLVLRAGSPRVGGVVQEVGSAKLTFQDVRELQEKVPAIRQLSPMVNGRVQVVFGNRNWNAELQGNSPNYADMRAAHPTDGRFFTEEENLTRARVALIGRTVVAELFEGQNPLGQTMKINRTSFTVIGVLPEKGSTGWRDQDNVVVIPLLTAMYRVLGKTYLDRIEMEVGDPAQMASVQEDALALMVKSHNVPPAQAQDAFEVRNMADIQQALSQSSQTMSFLLAAIAAISLLVGGIGIMNIMLVSVTERTREVGLRKAVGATRRDILLQFLIESVVVSGTGGLMGVLLGWVATQILSLAAGWTTTVTLPSVALAFFFSAGLGVVFGIYPAQKAAGLNPIEALRYE